MSKISLVLFIISSTLEVSKILRTFEIKFYFSTIKYLIIFYSSSSIVTNSVKKSSGDFNNSYTKLSLSIY